MHDFKSTIAEINDIAVLQCLGLRAGLHFVITGTETLVGNRLEVTVGYETELGRTQNHALISATQGLVLILMNKNLVELVAAAAVIEVNVAGHNLERFVQQIGEVEFQAGNTEPGIDQQVGIAALDQPQVGTIFPGISSDRFHHHRALLAFHLQLRAAGSALDVRAVLALFENLRRVEAKVHRA